MDNAVCVGYGMVGRATAHAFGIKNYYSPSNHTVEREDLYKFKYIFLCLPTPTNEGVQDNHLLTEYIAYITAQGKDNIFIVRSTVLPGFCKRAGKIARIAHVPEFLTEKTWKKDVEWPEIVVIGSDDTEVRDEVAGIFKARYKGASFIITDTVTSELTKYAINAFYALKVVFANDLFDYARGIKANYEEIKRAMYATKWVGSNHLDIWHQGGRGAGGKCLEKDLEAFAHASMSSVLLEANRTNKELIKSFPKENENTETS